MASILTHPVIPLAIGIGLGTKVIPVRLLVLASLASILPDLDVISFKLGIPYHSEYGHRGFTHSIVFAILGGLAIALFSMQLKSSRITVFIFITLAILSHSLVDALTNGGLGVAFLWPFNADRFFFSWRPIQVSPIGISRFMSEWGLRVILSELFYVWLPCLVLMLSMLLLQRIQLRK